MDKEDMMVSVCCITYNQKEYIRDAIEGFLKQKTNFKYEVIIHDDASTDGTTEIIKEYAEKYPDIIKPIFEEKNQYSQGVKRILNITYKYATGKYIALCEGDDYWIDEDKITEQVEYMEKHEDCAFCFHNAKVVDMSNGKSRPFIPNSKKIKKYVKKDGIYNVGELELLEFIPTASFMFRRENLEKMPQFYNECFVGDWPTKLIMTSFGYAYCIDKMMCVYRMNANGSVTKKNEENSRESIEKKINFLNEKIKFVRQMDEFTNKKYNDVFKLRESQFKIEKLIASGNTKKIKEEKYLKNLKGMTKLKFAVKVYFPKVAKIYKKVENKGE